jgi:hypothetical protein
MRLGNDLAGTQTLTYAQPRFDMGFGCDAIKGRWSEAASLRKLATSSQFGAGYARGTGAERRFVSARIDAARKMALRE